MHIFIPRDFDRATKRERLSDDALREAVCRAERGVIDADLGFRLIKQRIGRAGQGRSGGFRAILFYKRGALVVFLHLFAKSDKADLTPHERRAFRELAKELDRLTPAQIRSARMRELDHEQQGDEI